MRGLLVAVALLAVAAVSLWWLQHPPRGEEDYRKRSTQTAESLRSHVATARLWAAEIEDDRVLRGAAAIGLEETSKGADSTASTFSSWVPPAHLDDLRTTVSDAAASTTDLLSGLHVAAEQDEWDSVAEAQDELRELEATLAKVASEARP